MGDKRFHDPVKQAANARKGKAASPWSKGPNCHTYSAGLSHLRYRKAQQPDLIRNSDKALAAAHRLAADTAEINPHEDADARARRAAHHRAEADRLDPPKEPNR